MPNIAKILILLSSIHLASQAHAGSEAAESTSETSSKVGDYSIVKKPGSLSIDEDDKIIIERIRANLRIKLASKGDILQNYTKQNVSEKDTTSDH